MVPNVVPSISIALILVLFPSIPPQAKPWFCLASVKVRKTWECDRFPRARTSFERALHFRTTRFASVGDILKTVGKQDRRDFPYCHLAFAIRTDFHRGYYGTCQLRTHDVSFRPTKCRGGEKAHPGVGNLKSKSWKLAGSLCDSGSIANIVCLLSARVEEK